MRFVYWIVNVEDIDVAASLKGCTTLFPIKGNGDNFTFI